MKKKFTALFAAMLLGWSAIASADSTQWVMLDNIGNQVPMSQVSYLTAADGAKVFSIVKTDNSVINDVTSVSFKQEIVSGVEEVSSAAGQLFSRPVENSILISGAAGRHATVVDMKGSVVISRSIDSDSEQIDISTLPSGVYLLKVGSSTTKFMKK